MTFLVFFSLMDFRLSFFTIDFKKVKIPFLSVCLESSETLWFILFRFLWVRLYVILV